VSRLMVEPKDCGAGAGEKCCAYLLCGAEGFECGRETELKSQIEARVRSGTFNAKRLPIKPFPECQSEP
jgi:hypothetical protein